MHFNLRLEDGRLCMLVMIGARANGAKELLAVEDGYRESAESWRTLLREQACWVHKLVKRARQAASTVTTARQARAARDDVRRVLR